MSNAGGAWDNSKKYVEKGALSINGVVQKKGSELHKAAVVGDTVGDPFKDTSGPSLNIVMKLMAVLSLVFADFFMSINNGGGLINWQEK
jgi:Na+/H+-translocating membrane pyrophosphatase